MKSTRLHVTLRPAIAMIELIFAITVMGIVLMSVPQIIQTATSSGYVAIQQESINEAATRVSIIQGYAWDENNTDPLYVPPILHVTNGNGDLNETGTTGRRAGTPPQSNRTFVRNDNQEFNASTIGTDLGDAVPDDMDDFDGLTGLISIESATADYIEKATVRITTQVNYGSDTPTGGTYRDPGGDNEIDFSPILTTAAFAPTTNIKFITVTLESNSTSAELNQTKIKLHAFSSNIGGYDIEERTY